jgi:hypothetical protein
MFQFVETANTGVHLAHKAGFYVGDAGNAAE